MTSKPLDNPRGKTFIGPSAWRKFGGQLSIALATACLALVVGCGRAAKTEPAAIDTSGLVQSFQAADLDTRMSVVEVVELIKAKKFAEANLRLAELKRVARTEEQRQALTQLTEIIQAAASPGK